MYFSFVIGDQVPVFDPFIQKQLIKVFVFMGLNSFKHICQRLRLVNTVLVAGCHK